MLVRTIMPNDKITIGTVVLNVVSVTGGRLRLAIDCPRELEILHEKDGALKSPVYQGDARANATGK